MKVDQGGGTPFNLPDITWLVVWGPACQQETEEKMYMMILYIYIYIKKTPQQGAADNVSSLWSSTGILKISKCCRCERNPTLKWFGRSFSTLCLCLIPLTRHAKTRGGGIHPLDVSAACSGNTTPGVAESRPVSTLKLVCCLEDATKKTTSASQPLALPFPPTPERTDQATRPSCVDQWPHLKQRGTVNIYPGLPRTGLINEKERALLSTLLCPRGIITSLFFNPVSTYL